MSSRSELKDRTFLEMAVTLGKLGTCSRGHVGALITREGRCVSWGFNGAPEGLPHCEKNGHGYINQEGGIGILDLKPVEKLSDREKELMPWDARGGADYLASKFGCRNATHAEANALAFAARQGISTEGGTCYTECVPCASCARLLIAAGIKRVVSGREYRDPSGLELLQSAGVAVDVEGGIEEPD